MSNLIEALLVLPHLDLIAEGGYFPMRPTEFRIVDLLNSDAMTVRQYGAKAANLASLSAAKVPVPRGVAVGKDVLAYFLRECGLDLAALEHIHSLGMTFFESAISEASRWQAKIVNTIATAPFPSILEDALKDVLQDLVNCPVAVRSSCVVEDSSSASFAGQYATVLDVQGIDNILSALRTCWASQYDGRVLTYAIARRGMPVLVPSMAVLIQEMLRPSFAGVCFSNGPTPKTQHLAVVEAVAGVGEALVSGSETPSHYEVDKKGLIQGRFVPPGGTEPPTRTILAVVDASRRVASHFGCPQDVEWAAIDSALYILQARPITTLGGKRQTAPHELRDVAHREVASSILPSPKPPDQTQAIVLRDDLHEWLIGRVDPLTFRGATNLLSKQTADGCWRLEGYPEWDTVATGMILRLLIRGGMPPSIQWAPLNSQQAPATLGPPAAAAWLVQNVKGDGTWGTDLWDTCQVVMGLLAYGVAPDEPLIARAIEFIADEIARGLAQSRDQEWVGAGFVAAALETLSITGMADAANKAVQLLLESQGPDGDFFGPDRTGPRVPSEWHTTQAISALARFAGPRAANAVAHACAWLASRQHINGAWGVAEEPYSHYNGFFTAFAVIALADAGQQASIHVTKAVKWLRGQQLASGAFGDLGSSLMAMAALQRLQGPAFSLKLPIPIFLRIQAVLSGGYEDTGLGKR